MSRNRDALKFFQAYIKEMIDVGGANLPKSISVSLGAKLGKLLRERGIIGLENSLKKIYKVLNAKTKIKTIDDKTLDITLKPDRAELIQNTICIPYTVAILNSSHPEYKYNSEILECILNSNNRRCRYRLIIEPKSGNKRKE